MTENTAAPDPLDAARRETIDALVEHMADEKLAVEEFERRVQLVRAARDADDVRAALSGLPGRGSVGG